MTYPGNFLKLAVSGRLYDAEQFTWTLSMVPDGVGADAPTEVSADVRTAVETFHKASSWTIAVLELIKLNELDDMGHYVRPTTVQHEYPVAGVTGSGATATMPPQVALAVTLETGYLRGRAARGRFYVPTPQVNISTGARITIADAQRIATAAAAMIDALNAAVPGYRVGVASDLDAGMFRPVTAVTVGRVLDTIRSRRASLDEDRQAADVTSVADPNFTGDGGGF